MQTSQYTQRYDWPVSSEGMSISWTPSPVEEIYRQVAQSIATDRDGKIREVLIGLGWAPLPRFEEYLGMTYSAASREASKLIADAGKSGNWIKDLPERLVALREVMRRHMDAT